MLVISEEWSSDCRRDVPFLARLAEAGGLQLRIFTRDGRTLGRGATADPAESPNADLVNAFLNVKEGRTYQSVPVAASSPAGSSPCITTSSTRRSITRTAWPPRCRSPRPGETAEQAWPRFIGEWGALQESPFFSLWASATVDEILSALHERIVIGIALACRPDAAHPRRCA